MMDLVELSRLQFAVTALYHFIFVPLTLGLSVLLGIMETVYVMTGREIWRDMVKFWGILFGINFAMGVATGLTMEFQFGTNWAYYSQYVGDVFGAPLAIEGLMAFFLEATFIGLFFFAWDRLSKIQHLFATWTLALGTNLSALWILIANGWMQYPVGARFNADTMRMEVSDFMAVLFNPVAQAKFVHTVSAGYVTGSVFVLAISAWYLLKGRHVEFARRSMTVAASFGLASALSVVVLGDESGYNARMALDAHVNNLGYALLLKNIRSDIENASPEEIARAADSTVPNVPVLFWSFRIMVGLGLWFIALFAASFWFSAKRQLDRYRTFLWAAFLTLPLPWIAAELGWIVAEYGRQPWVIVGVLPTALGVSSTTAGNVLLSLTGFALFYSCLLVVDMYLLVKYIRQGPDKALASLNHKEEAA
jgi:cytochrome bd-type quinol oxidase subunit 1